MTARLFVGGPLDGQWRDVDPGMDAVRVERAQSLRGDYGVPGPVCPDYVVYYAERVSVPGSARVVRATVMVEADLRGSGSDEWLPVVERHARDLAAQALASTPVGLRVSL